MPISFKKLDPYRWLIPKTGKMRVPGLVFSNHELIKQIKGDQSLNQVANVAALPGIVGHSLAMPDIHMGYGFPIGGVAAFDLDEGIISPGGVGYDINCGCRVMTTQLRADEIRPLLKELVKDLYQTIPSGVGSTGKIHLSKKDIRTVSKQGALWAVKNGFGEPEDLEKTEDHGIMEGADPSVISERAFVRGENQLGTLGSGNHFLEIQVVDQVFDIEKANAFHLHEGQIAVFIHTGSRGFGYQICDDFLKFIAAKSDNRSAPVDRQLVSAPLRSGPGKRYFSAMACAANYAWANRQIIMHWTREAMSRNLCISPSEMGMRLLYDVCHNIAKIEKHTLQGTQTRLCVHRKGATRALPPRHSLLPDIYRKTGQPVLIPGDMGTCSYILAGAESAMAQSFGSCCHGAGRLLSRSQAVKKAKGRSIGNELEARGIYVLSRGKKTLSEEMSEAYKDVSQVVDTVHGSGLAFRVARLKPLGVIKG